MEMLSYSPISLTPYSHVVPELAEDAARRMGEALWGEPSTTLAPRDEG